MVGEFLKANFIVANVIPVRAAVTGFLAVKIRFTVPAAEPLLESWFSGKPRAVLEAVLVVDKKKAEFGSSWQEGVDAGGATEKLPEASSEQIPEESSEELPEESLELVEEECCWYHTQ